MVNSSHQESVVNKARRLELGSTIAQRVPPLNWFVHGTKNTIPHLEYRQWLYVPGLLASTVDWVKLEGDPGMKSDLPSHWRAAALLAVDRLDLAGLAANRHMGGVPAYFYRLDQDADAVMATPLPYGEGSKFSGDLEAAIDRSYLAIAARIGGSVLSASIGLLDVETTKAATLTSEQIHAKRTDTYAINHGPSFANVAVI